jgi:hypothetical protein
MSGFVQINRPIVVLPVRAVKSLRSRDTFSPLWQESMHCGIAL